MDYRPQLATLVHRPPSGDEFLSELKYDGYRMGCLVLEGVPRLISRNGNDWSASFPEVIKAVRELQLQQALIDGEMTVLTVDGRTSFQSLQNAASAARRGLLTYFIFDLLQLQDRDLRGEPLETRKAVLRTILQAHGRARSPLRLVDHVIGHGPEVFKRACELGAEGIVCKRRERPYRPGRNSDWLKIKCTRSGRFVIGGFTDPGGARAGFGGLLVGYYDQAELVYAGRVGTGKGFTDAFLLELRRVLGLLEQARCPFAPRSRAALPRRAHWIRPELVIEVSYLERTGDGYLRHPSFSGFCPGVDPRAVHKPG